MIHVSLPFLSAFQIKKFFGGQVELWCADMINYLVKSEMPKEWTNNDDITHFLALVSSFFRMACIFSHVTKTKVKGGMCPMTKF